MKTVIDAVGGEEKATAYFALGAILAVGLTWFVETQVH
jgi:hypothetical protein